MRMPLGHDGPEVVLDVDASRLTVAGRTLRVRGVDFAESIFRSTLDLVGVLLARNPRLASNPYLADLEEESRGWLDLLTEVEAPAEAIPAPPPGPAPRDASIGAPPLRGDLRKVAWRTAWEVELGSIRGFVPVKGGAWALDDQGATRLSLERGRLQRLDEGIGVACLEEGPSLVLLPGGRLRAVDEAGATLWERTHALGAPHPRACRVGDAAWLLGDRRGLWAVGLSDGARRFHFEPPAAHRARVSFSGTLAALAADNGMLYAFDLAAATLAWRLPLQLAAVAVGPAGIWGLADGRRGLELFCVGAEDRSIRSRTELPLEAPGALLPTETGVVVGGSGGAGGEVVAVHADGAVAWRARPILGPGAPWITRAGGALFVRGSRGVARIEGGEVRWSSPCGPGGPPLVTRGMVILPGERLSIRDAATGREVLPSRAAAALPAADHVVAGDDGALLLCDIHGRCAGLRLSGGLAVVPSPRP